MIGSIAATTKRQRSDAAAPCCGGNFTVKDCQETRRRLQPTTGLAIPGPEELQIKAWCDEHERFSAFAGARLYPVPAKPSHYDVGVRASRNSSSNSI